ncbi:unnamed protein product, partial [Polarella glacialis]
AHAICLAYRKAAWSLLERGEQDVADDLPTKYYGTRGTQWMRLAHKKTNRTVFFVNHHGPLSVNSGGLCGGEATANNLLHLMGTKAQAGDVLILVGDFNANGASTTIQSLWKHLVHVYNGDSFGGVDNIFSNVKKSQVFRGYSALQHWHMGAVTTMPSAPCCKLAQELQHLQSQLPVQSLASLWAICLAAGSLVMLGKTSGVAGAVCLRIVRDRSECRLLGGSILARTSQALVAAGGNHDGRERASKRPLFDLSGLDKPAKPIETEPVQKHQLSERAAQWQLHKDVPPYMIDRITMPSWQTWSKCDFACLGLRPHLMLKLVRKPEPDGEGPHAFSDLFATVVVENPEAFPWLAAQSNVRRGGADEDDAPMNFGDDGAGDEDYDGSGLPAHLDVDPQELFLGPDDKVVPGCDGEDFGHVEDDNGYMPDLDFDLTDKPETAVGIDIGYSRNSKFVDVKLVKKHL